MKYFSLIPLVLTSYFCSAQMSIRQIYFENDFSPYDTYAVQSFKLNGHEIDHKYSMRTKLLVEKLHHVMEKIGFKEHTDGDFYFTYKMKVDTLPIGFQRTEGPLAQDIVADITIEIFDAEYNERLFAGNIYGLLVEDKKSAKIIKRIYRKLFRDIEE